MAAKILHRETKRVKFDGAVIIPSELTNRDEIFDNLRGNESMRDVEKSVWGSVVWPIEVIGIAEPLPTIA